MKSLDLMLISLEHTAALVVLIDPLSLFPNKEK